ncbi:MAG: AraC family transcriptional regulator [Clostridiales bacterium]|nr:AraC family transcriptional regulator [Clostridiales bacterium]
MFYQYAHFGKNDYFLKEYGTDFSFPAHMHFSFECIVVTEGEMTVSVNGEEERLTEGEAVLIFPNRLHALTSHGCRHMLCIFAPELISYFWEKVRNKTPDSYRFRPSKEILFALNGMNGEEDTTYKKGVLYLLCAEFDRERTYQTEDREERELLPAVFRYVESHYTENCTLGGVANAVGYEYGYLSRYFKKRTGVAFTEYLNHYRLNRACYYLTNTDKTVLDISLSVGYDSLRSFTRNFKKLFGITAVEYRKNAKVNG